MRATQTIVCISVGKSFTYQHLGGETTLEVGHVLYEGTHEDIPESFLPNGSWNIVWGHGCNSQIPRDNLQADVWVMIPTPSERISIESLLPAPLLSGWSGPASCTGSGGDVAVSCGPGQPDEADNG